MFELLETVTSHLFLPIYSVSILKKLRSLPFVKWKQKTILGAHSYFFTLLPKHQRHMYKLAKGLKPKPLINN